MEQVICPISENARSTPQQTALISDKGTWSYLELDNCIHSLCHFLSQAGIREHQRIAFIAKSEPATIMLLFALFRIRAIACPLSFRSPQQQVAKHLSLLKAAHVLEPATLPQCSDKCDHAPTLISLNSPATFLFTSGSSGTPKVACHSFANHYYNALGALLPLQLESSSRWLLSLPLYHVSGIGILFRCFQKGAAVALSEYSTAEAIVRYDISHISVVPTQLQRLLSERIASLKCILLGGAPLSPALLEKSRHLPVFTTYGMTEMASIITLSDGKSEPHAGQTLAFRELRIEDDGEIWVKGKTLFLGYWDAASESILKADIHSWFPTKDLGKLDAQGNLEIVGRKDRLFISGGENIQPEEIEHALCTLPGIRQAAVLPIADPEFGHRPVAFIDDETGKHTLLTIREGLEPLLPSFKHPVRILPLPADAGLKPSLSVLRKHLTHFQESSSGNLE